MQTKKIKIKLKKNGPFLRELLEHVLQQKEGVDQETGGPQHRRHEKAILEVILKEYFQFDSYNRLDSNQSKFQ